MVEEQLIKELEMYFSIYEDEYTKDELEFIRDNFVKFYKEEIHIDIISQIFVALGIKTNDDKYKKYLEYLKSRYQLDKNILEVACGHFPALAKYIDEYQKEIKSGTITAYDPRLVTTKYGKINWYKKLFDESIDISNISLITGMFPSEATTKIIELANAKNKDFSVLTCGCAHLPEEEFFYYPAHIFSWQNYLYRLAKKDLDSSRTIDIDYIDGIDTPVISSRKK